MKLSRDFKIFLTVFLLFVAMLAILSALYWYLDGVSPIPLYIIAGLFAAGLFWRWHRLYRRQPKLALNLAIAVIYAGLVGYFWFQAWKWDYMVAKFNGNSETTEIRKIGNYLEALFKTTALSALTLAFLGVLKSTKYYQQIEAGQHVIIQKARLFTRQSLSTKNYVTSLIIVNLVIFLLLAFLFGWNLLREDSFSDTTFRTIFIIPHVINGLVFLIFAVATFFCRQISRRWLTVLKMFGILLITAVLTFLISSVAVGVGMLVADEFFD